MRFLPASPLSSLDSRFTIRLNFSLPNSTSLSYSNMTDTKESPSASLSATYDSPSGHRDFTYTVSTPQVKNDGSVDIEAKTTYLSELRVSTRKLQEDINKFLTEKMEEDKKVAGPNGASRQESKDELEEENYGEEDAEDDT
ncbi:hypothetical protein PV04_00875 [Phialophora macrospora]|uniref:EKC/KEOPS complex subunit GON7 n=1 Tax=Phialophora macrospora TaxID=1851006 RepID=A0A0D2FW54_9EURO|nr:hypothetical protein PV04_00875 [Phialophora macrospora]